MNVKNENNDWPIGTEIDEVGSSNIAMVDEHSCEAPDHGGNQVSQYPVLNLPPTEVTTTINNNNNGNNDENLVGVEDDMVVEPICEPFVGMIFDTIEASHIFWEKYARQTGFRSRIRRTVSKNGIISMRSYVCTKEGTTCEDPRRISNKRRRQTRCGCEAIMTVSLVKGTRTYRVGSFNKEHNHSLYGPPREASQLSEQARGQGVYKPIVGMEFDTIEASQAFWERYAYDVGFRSRIRSSNTKNGLVRTTTYVCSKEGRKFYDPRVSSSNRRVEKRCGCSVHMTINWVNKKGIYRVASFFEEHNHGIDGIGSIPRMTLPPQHVGEGPIPNLTNEPASDSDHELDYEHNTSGLREHDENEGLTHDRMIPNGSGPKIMEGPLKNLDNAQRMGILCSEFTQLAYRAVSNNEVFEGVRRLIRKGHTLADRY